MRLQTEGAPDPADGRMRQADLGSHGTDRPVGRVFGRCVQRALDDLRNLRIRHRARPAGTVFVGSGLRYHLRQTAAAICRRCAHAPPGVQQLPCSASLRHRAEPSGSDPTTTAAPCDAGPALQETSAPADSAPPDLPVVPPSFCSRHCDRNII